MLPRVFRGDAFEVVFSWPKASVDLIVTDPPYGKILKAKWDKTWSLVSYRSLTEVIDFLLKPGGTAYVWGGIGRPGNRLFFQWLGDLETQFPSLTIYDVITWRKAEKPSRLAEIMIETSSRIGEHVVDLFAGSGSTGVAAMKIGRKCTLVEKSDCVMHDFKAVT